MPDLRRPKNPNWAIRSGVDLSIANLLLISATASVVEVGIQVPVVVGAALRNTRSASHS